MNQKYKVHEVAKDLNIQSNDIIELLQKTFGTTKKYQTALTADELNVIFEKYTQDNQVKTFANYFAAANKPKAPEKPKEKPKAEQAVKPVEKTAEQAKAKPVQNEQAKDGKIAEKPKSVQTPQAQQPQRTQQNQQNRQRNDNRQGNRQDNRQGNRQAGNQNVQRQGEKAPQRAKTTQPIQPRPIKPVVDASKVKVNAPPKAKVKGEAVQRGEQVTRKVDTRGTYVELDKYNERYERIAPVSNMGNERITKKQKINQRSGRRGRNQFASKKRETEAEKLQRLELERARKQQLKVLIPDEIMISDLASRLKVTASAVIKKLMGLGEMCTINQVIDFDTASLVADEFGAKVEREVIVTIEERLFEEIVDTSENTAPRSPVVVVMGHVDHGKTSLLDRIRQADVTSTEAGGITQHIGAYRVNANGRDITFLDTPGHEAFTSMRARGASITDIAILVVAADDGIMPQTIEAINHAKAAGVSIIVAVNKMDKEAANPERIKQELTEHELVVEEWGGETICVPVSAKTGMGIDELLEMVSITADVLELKANPDRMAVGTVIEAKLDKGRGPVATVLVRSGTLKTGDVIIAGMSVGRVRVMKNDKGETVNEAGPSVPVEIMGLADVPSAGDIFNVVEDEKLARELVDKRRYEAKEEIANLYQKVTLDNLFSQIEQGNIKELPVIVKADVQGTAEAVKQSLEKLTNEEVRVRVIHAAVGAVSESDVMLASASGAIIVGFNVRPHPAAADNAKRDEVDLRFYRIIYDAIDEISTAMKGMLDPKYREVQLGRIEVRNLFKISSVGTVAGSYVLDGKVTRASQIRVVRDGIVIAEDKIISLKRFKDDIKEVTAGFECGITLDKFHDLKEGDIFESLIMEEYRD